MMGPIMMYEPHGGGIWLFLRILFSLLIVVGIILFVVWVVKQTRKFEQTHGLEKRNARGQIREDEYQRIHETSLNETPFAGRHRLIIIAVILIVLGLIGIFAIR